MQDYPQHQDGSGPPRRGSVTGGAGHQPFERAGAVDTLGGHPHGKKSSWVVTGIVIIAFLAGGASLILHIWWLFWTCLGVFLLSIPVGKAIGVMNDTVVYGGTAAPQETSPPRRGDLR